jgi:hypothetical protein
MLVVLVSLIFGQQSENLANYDHIFVHHEFFDMLPWHFLSCHIYQ